MLSIQEECWRGIIYNKVEGLAIEMGLGRDILLEERNGTYHYVPFPNKPINHDYF